MFTVQCFRSKSSTAQISYSWDIEYWKVIKNATSKNFGDTKIR